MLNRAIEIHDSILAGVSISQGVVELDFSSVYIHQSRDAPGRDPGSGWVQRAKLRIYDAKVKGVFSEFPVDLSDGQVRMGEHTIHNLIPLPMRYKGPFELRLEAMWQAKDIVPFAGSGAELELVGEPEYVEEFRPKKKS